MRHSSRYEFYELPSYGNTSIYTEDLSSADSEVIKDVALRRSGYLSSVYIMSYILVFIAIALLGSAGTILFLTYRQASGIGGLSSVESLKLVSGSCDSELHTYNVVAHLFINLLGTVILGTSNYLQQICTSPSIVEIVSQIEKRGDVSFGANSPSALFRQKSASLKFFWLSLVLTSLPIHIMLNGIVGYAIFTINNVSYQAVESSEVSSKYYGTAWANIASSTCASFLLNSNIVTDYNNLTIVVNPGAPFEYYEETEFEFPGGVDYMPTASDLANCYVNYVTSECQLTIRWFPLVCTATAVFIKSLIVFIVVRRHPHFRKRVFNSLGDMIALGARYPHLREKCSQKPMFPGYCRKQRIRWVRALGRWDLLVAIFWWVSALGVGTYGVISWIQLGGQLNVGDRIKAFGLGTITQETSFVVGNGGYEGEDTANTFPLLIIIGNSPQLWLSFGYLLWNAQITRIWMEREWRSYYRKAHLPRVSYHTDEPGVGSTRWLQLPYWLTMTLMVISTLMHWLVSQTLFVVEILAAENSHYYYLNYSPLAIISIGVVASVLVLAITIYYFVPVKTWMPLMAGSGRVVFQSCSQLPAKLPLGGLAWGDISTYTERLAGFGETVAPLVTGVMYPGLIADEPKLDMNSEYSFRADSDMEPLVRRY